MRKIIKYQYLFYTRIYFHKRYWRACRC